MRCEYVTDMRTTIRIDDELLRKAKRLAAETGRSLTGLIEDALRETMSRRPAPASEPVRLVTSPGRPRPGIDLDDTASLLDLTDDSQT